MRVRDAQIHITLFWPSFSNILKAIILLHNFPLSISDTCIVVAQIVWRRIKWSRARFRPPNERTFSYQSSEPAPTCPVESNNPNPWHLTVQSSPTSIYSTKACTTALTICLIELIDIVKGMSTITKGLLNTSERRHSCLSLVLHFCLPNLLQRC